MKLYCPKNTCCEPVSGTVVRKLVKATSGVVDIFACASASKSALSFSAAACLCCSTNWSFSFLAVSFPSMFATCLLETSISCSIFCAIGLFAMSGPAIVVNAAGPILVTFPEVCIVVSVELMLFRFKLTSATELPLLVPLS